MTGANKLLIHGTCVALRGKAALLKGAPGAGKSDLALRFVSSFTEDGAALVADDQVRVWCRGDCLAVGPPETLTGLLEVRGLGIVEMPHVTGAILGLIVTLSPSDQIPRLPRDPLPREDLLGHSLPMLTLAPFEVSAAVKLKLALERLSEG
ncbi:MAG: aldolase [Hyphomicrobiales bacterium]|nr:aldolase [Hyphomicrobiales bacterium]